MLTCLHPAALIELFTRHLLTAEECSKLARNEWWEWEYHLNEVLLTKSAEAVQKACQVMEKHGCPVEVELKSELYYSSTLCQVAFQVVRANLIVTHASDVRPPLGQCVQWEWSGHVPMSVPCLITQHMW